MRYHCHHDPGIIAFINTFVISIEDVGVIVTPPCISIILFVNSSVFARGGTGIGSHERHSQRRRGGGGPVVTDTRGSGAYYHYFIHDVGDDTMPGC